MRFLIFILSALLFSWSSNGATITATSADQADVQTAITASSDGDTVVIPAGTATWTSTMTITKAITLEGSGYSDGGTPSVKTDDSWGTVITDAVNAGNGIMISWSTTSGKSYRMSKINIIGGKSATTNFGVIQLAGTSTSMRLDRLRLQSLHSFYVWVGSAVNGVADNCWFSGNSGKIVFQHQMGSQFSDSNGLGDGSWENALTWGSSGFWFIEDCLSDTSCVLTDGWRGSRFVVRYNSIVNGSVQCHGTESGQRYRGNRAIECYNNVFTFNDGLSHDSAIYIRSGALLAYNNSLVTSGATLTNGVSLVNYRNNTEFAPWGIADGTRLWDTADTSDDASTPGGAGDGVFETGTITAKTTSTITDSSKAWAPNAFTSKKLRTFTSYTSTSGTSSGTITVTVTGAGWTTNQWAGATITKGATATGEKGVVASNTSDTLTLSSTWYRPICTVGTVFQLGKSVQIASNTGTVLTLTSNFQGNYPSFSVGDSYEIRGITQALDQPGMGVTTNITGDESGLNYGNPPHQNLSQALQPCYIWNNTLGAGVTRLVSKYASVVQNTHYYLSAPSGYTQYTYPHPLQDVSGGGPEDTTAPTLSSAAISTSGLQLILTFSESVQGAAAAHYTLSGGHTLGSPTTSLGTVTFPITPVVLNTETLTVGYTSGAGRTADLTGNLLATFSGTSVTNNSLELTPVPNRPARKGGIKSVTQGR